MTGWRKRDWLVTVMRAKDTDELTITINYEMYRKIINILERECLNVEYYFEVEELVHMIDHLRKEVAMFQEEKKKIEGKGN